MKMLSDIITDHKDTLVTVEAITITESDDPEVGDSVVMTIDGEEYLTFDQNIVKLAKTWKLPARVKFWRTSYLSAAVPTA